MEWMIISGLLFSAFLCGSVPTGYLIVKATKGIDIRTVGSGNIGSTNVSRIAGRKAAVITQVADILKGAIPVAVSAMLISELELPCNRDLLVSATGLAAIIGHDFTPFLGFRGGKGVNTTVGSFLIMAPIPTAIAVGSYFALRLATGIISVGSIVLGIVLPIAVGCLRLPLPILIASAVAGSLILIQHKDNIGRLVRGEERKVPGLGPGCHPAERSPDSGSPQ
jgi:glycerol-3-phosphate acyltransferase PlsY